MNARRKDNRNTQRSLRLLEMAGYKVSRTTGSLRMFDLHGFCATDTVLCRVTAKLPPAPVERDALAGFRCPANCKRLIHVWHDHEHRPQVIEL